MRMGSCLKQMTHKKLQSRRPFQVPIAPNTLAIEMDPCISGGERPFMHKGETFATIA